MTVVAFPGLSWALWIGSNAAVGRPLTPGVPTRHHRLLGATWRRFEPCPPPSASLAPALYSLHEVVGNKPSISGHFCRLVLLRVAHFSPGALDSANSVRFSKFECFRMFMNSNEMGFL